MEARCEACDGTGTIVDVVKRDIYRCATCAGTGRITQCEGCGKILGPAKDNPYGTCDFQCSMAAWKPPVTLLQHSAIRASRADEINPQKPLDISP